ncbi:hypothetical protein MTR67_022801 [Solanum verrucosum]|uniref:DUF4283 domain-containing protein n=1 Tax=Solanum verrucosum TaxID=315347 RepID=A0AAF0QU05_SOLVR|nr:hypothetical protein MTR67_022801 [Solanum verrucosum]
MLSGTLTEVRERPFPFWLKPGFPVSFLENAKFQSNMGENIVYFAAGFKLYDITRTKSRTDAWFDLVERSRSLMRRTTFSKKTMEWLCFALQEASKDKEKHMRRWKLKEQQVGFFNTMDGKPTLADVRRWSVSTWKNAFAVNTYDKGNNFFLFGFPTKHMAEHVLQGEWRWKKEKIPLEWWHLSFGCCSDRQERRYVDLIHGFTSAFQQHTQCNATCGV